MFSELPDVTLTVYIFQLTQNHDIESAKIAKGGPKKICYEPLIFEKYVYIHI